MDGRHLRCSGRHGCTCSICTPTSASAQRTKDRITQRPKRTKPPAPRAERAPRVIVARDDIPAPSRTFTHAELRVAEDVIRELGRIVEHERVRRGMSLRATADQMDLNGAVLRRFLEDDLVQGLTTRSVKRVLVWLVKDPSTTPLAQ